MHEQFPVVWQLLSEVSSKCASLRADDQPRPPSDRVARRRLLEHRAFAIFLFSHALIYKKHPREAFATSLELCTLAVEAEFDKSEVEGGDLWAFLGARANSYGEASNRSNSLSEEASGWCAVLHGYLNACDLEGPLRLSPPIVIDDVVTSFLSRADILSKIAEFYVPLCFVPIVGMLGQFPNYLKAPKREVEAAIRQGLQRPEQPNAAPATSGFFSRLFGRK